MLNKGAGYEKVKAGVMTQATLRLDCAAAGLACAAQSLCYNVFTFVCFCRAEPT